MVSATQLTGGRVRSSSTDWSTDWSTDCSTESSMAHAVVAEDVHDGCGLWCLVDGGGWLHGTSLTAGEGPSTGPAVNVGFTLRQPTCLEDVVQDRRCHSAPEVLGEHQSQSVALSSSWGRPRARSLQPSSEPLPGKGPGRQRPPTVHVEPIGMPPEESEPLVKYRRHGPQPQQCPSRMAQPPSPSPPPPLPPLDIFDSQPSCPGEHEGEQGHGLHEQPSQLDGQQPILTGLPEARADSGNEPVAVVDGGAPHGHRVFFDGDSEVGANRDAAWDDGTPPVSPCKPLAMPLLHSSGSDLPNSASSKIIPVPDAERDSPLVRAPHAVVLSCRLIRKANVSRTWSRCSEFDRRGLVCPLNKHLESVFRQMPMLLAEPAALVA